jgi:phenazine biosynthesis protein phzE
MKASPDRALGPPSLLSRLLVADPPPFAMLYRPTVAGSRVDVITGSVTAVRRLADIPLDSGLREERLPPPAHDLLVLVPYRQGAERGFDCTDDCEPILVLEVAEHATETLATMLRRLPDEEVGLTGAGFDIADDDYADLVRRVIAQEIGQGAGSNFVVKRAFTGTFKNWSPNKALSVFLRLLASEVGAYWTFVVYTGTRTFVGASPEMHISLDAGLVAMNPISGTYRYPVGGPTLAGVTSFLRDRKETEELYMVVDEELKMMAQICDLGGRVHGPYLKEMARLAHTEYLLDGASSLDVRDLLRTTMFAPTVTGSPIENACRVLARYEPTARGFYSGIIALIGRDATAEQWLDSAILIRTADISEHGLLRLGTGATLVRHSDPRSEVAETTAKAAALLTAAGIGADQSRVAPVAHPSDDPRALGRHPAVRAMLARRNDGLAQFWFERPDVRLRPRTAFTGREVLVVDAEDSFTCMLGLQLRALGLSVRIESWDRVASRPEITGLFDAVVLGPGPGDPRDLSDARIAALHSLTLRLLGERVPLLAICLSHQVLADLLGLPLARNSAPSQGLQRGIDLFGRSRLVGFYNTFAAVTARELVPSMNGMPAAQVSRDHSTGEVYALQGTAFASVQFHPESVLTQEGSDILADLLSTIIRGQPGSYSPSVSGVR